MDTYPCFNMVKRTEKIELYTHSEEETENIGRIISSCLIGNELIFLIGELGAGKTVLVRGIARGAGVQRRIRSSSFVLLSQYTNGIFPIYHVDLYRIDFEDLTDLCLDDFLGEGVVLIEWADKIIDKLDPDLLVKIEIMNETTRFIRFQGEKRIINCLSKEFKNAGFID